MANELPESDAGAVPETTSSSCQRIGFGRLLLLSYAICGGSLIIDQTLSWTDHWEGLLNGVVQQIFLFVGWSLWMLPWSAVIWVIYEWRGWQRYRTAWVLALPVLYACWILGTLVVFPPTAHGSFKRFANAEIPADAKNVKYHLWGGGMADYSINYYFECSPGSLDKLATDMNMGMGGEMTTAESIPHLPHIKRLSGCPDHTQWVGGRAYSRETGKWFFHIITDPSKTKAYVWISSI